MLISDWSSDVCSSDLLARTPARVAARSFEPRWARRAAIVLSAAVPPIAEPSAELDSCRVCSPRFLAAATESLTKETGSKSRRPAAALEIAPELSWLIPQRRQIGRASGRERVWQTV